MLRRRAGIRIKKRGGRAPVIRWYGSEIRELIALADHRNRRLIYAVPRPKLPSPITMQDLMSSGSEPSGRLLVGSTMMANFDDPLTDGTGSAFC